jgi:hypothetical protein
MADRVVAFISPEHADKIDWKEEMEVVEVLETGEEEESDRLFTFEVSKTNEQEENVEARPGFMVRFVIHAQSKLLGLNSNEPSDA